jgi:polyisoprenoid-binding protein YceI
MYNASMSRTILTAILCSYALTAGAQKIDTERSVIRFSLSSLKVRTIEGTFTGIEGDIRFDAENPAGSDFRVCFDAATIQTGKTSRDADLRSADYFEVETYPLICFASDLVEQTSTGYRTRGRLTMHGVTRDVHIDFTLNNGEFRGILNVNRYDFHIGLQTGSFKVGNEVRMEICCFLAGNGGED